MKPLTLQQVRQAVAGRYLSAESAGVYVSSVCTDTRLMDSGCLFIALRGDRFDGNHFVPQAAAKGAIAALVDTPPADPLPNVHYIQVTDTRKAMGKLATFVRQQMRCKVVGVAGSNGKTSTKHLIDAALSLKLRGSISPKSFNNDIGVPLAIFPADPLQDYLVLEMGTNHHGEIRVLTDMARPDIAVITNCGPEHLEGLTDLAGVRRENASIIEGLNPKGLLVVNGDDAELLKAVELYPGQKVKFGFKESNDLFATDIRCTADGTSFRLNNRPREIFVPLLGKHTASNALAAIAVARKLGVDEEAIFAGLASTQGADMRLQLSNLDGGIALLNDAYNANPASMKAALETLAALPSLGRRVAILGDMRELGETSDRYHSELGAFAASIRPDLVVCVGEHSALMADAAQAALPAERVVHFPDAHTAAEIVPTMLRPGDLVLLKASRGIHLELLAEAIVGQRQAASRAVAS
jgi:UDP-N-acetylmuramoyl-tripeptide--D-alanyl-D-alanine ligase